MQKKNFSIQFLICLCYELIACPLLLNSNKVYFASSLIAKPNIHTDYSIVLQSDGLYEYASIMTSMKVKLRNMGRKDDITLG